MKELAADKLPIFESVFKKQWEQLPDVFRKHYDIRPYTEDKTTVQGNMDIKCNRFLKLLRPFYRLLRNIPIVTQSSVPVTVNFHSNPNNNAFYFNRVFSFPNQVPYQFNSRMLRLDDNLIVEEMKFGFCWKTRFEYKENSVIMHHHSYALKLRNFYLRLPFELLIGKGDAVERKIDADGFEMRLEVTHPLFGLIYSYAGSFKFITNE